MIALSTLAKTIENGLNAIGTKEFTIFADIGEFKGAYRGENSNNITRYINGIMEAMTPTRLPMKNLEVITQSFRVSFILDVALLNKDDNGNFIEVQEIRDVLEKYINANNGISYYATDSEQKQFEITPTFSGVTVGTAQQLSPIGDVLPMYLDFSCVFIQGGVNTNTIEFIINGKNMFYQNYTMSRTRIAETNMVANEKSSKTLAQANGISLNLAMPLIDEEASKNIEDDVYNGTQNQAICVERYRANAKNPYNCYIMIYGNNNESGSIGQNVGQTVDFVEGKQSELNYGENWVELEATVTSEDLTYSFTPPSDTNDLVIFWGDTTSQHSQIPLTNPRTPITHTYTKAGTYKIRYFKYQIPTLNSYIYNFYAKKNDDEIGGGLLDIKYTLGPTKTEPSLTNIYELNEQKIIIDKYILYYGESNFIKDKPDIEIDAFANIGYVFDKWYLTSTTTEFKENQIIGGKLANVIEKTYNYTAKFNKI